MIHYSVDKTIQSVTEIKEKQRNPYQTRPDTIVLPANRGEGARAMQVSVVGDAASRLALPGRLAQLSLHHGQLDSQSHLPGRRRDRQARGEGRLSQSREDPSQRRHGQARRSRH